MIALAAFLIAAQGAAMPSTYNGVWVSSEGFEFTVANPYTIWTTLNHRHYSAYQMVSATSGFGGSYNASRTMVPGFTTEPVTKAQYDLMGDPTTKFPFADLGVPMEMPCVQITTKAKSAESGTLQIAPGASDSQLHLSWTDSTGAVAYSGNVEKKGDNSLISVDGTYVDREASISVSQEGDSPKRALVGTVTLSGTPYKMKGLLVWGRGTFVLTRSDNGDKVGKGWIEWDPSADFCKALSTPQPSDRIMAYVEIKRGSSVVGSTHLLTRSAQ